MEQFSLSLWLKDMSRKVCTRDGRLVRILCWDIDSDTPILVAFRLRQDREEVFAYGADGKSIVNLEYDLFFADEKDELTEFEKRLKEILYEHATTNSTSEQKAKQYAPELLDIARKEVEKEITKEVEQKAINHTYAYQNGYENGKYDALKDLPKWKKRKDFDYPTQFCGVLITGGDTTTLPVLAVDGYEIPIKDLLESLPKEE